MTSIDKKCKHDILVKTGEVKSNSGIPYVVGYCLDCGYKDLLIDEINEINNNIRYKRNTAIEKIFGIDSEVYSKIKTKNSKESEK